MKHDDSYSDEFDQLTGEISDVVEEIPDPVVVGKLLYNIASEKKSYNLVVRDINAKFDQIGAKLDRITTLLEGISQTKAETPAQTERRAESVEISDRDREILDFVRQKRGYAQTMSRTDSSTKAGMPQAQGFTGSTATGSCRRSTPEGTYITPLQRGNKSAYSTNHLHPSPTNVGVVCSTNHLHHDPPCVGGLMVYV